MSNLKNHKATSSATVLTSDSPDEVLRESKLAFALWLVDYPTELPPKEELSKAFVAERGKYIQRARRVTKHLANQGVNLV
jgi:hypothetical protein